METAKNIANEIIRVVEESLAAGTSSSDLTKNLWEKAHKVGVAQEVDTLLQAHATVEMEEAIKAFL